MGKPCDSLRGIVKKPARQSYQIDRLKICKSPRCGVESKAIKSHSVNSTCTEGYLDTQSAAVSSTGSGVSRSAGSPALEAPGVLSDGPTISGSGIWMSS